MVLPMLDIRRENIYPLINAFITGNLGTQESPAHPVKMQSGWTFVSHPDSRRHVNRHDWLIGYAGYWLLLNVWMPFLP